jgi:hypothetical protein
MPPAQGLAAGPTLLVVVEVEVALAIAEFPALGHIFRFFSFVFSEPIRP